MALKIGLLTYHFSDNYGALYQAYALREWFRERGHVAEFIPYHPHYVEDGGSFDRPWNPALWRKNATILYMKFSQLQRRLLGDAKMRAGFEAFRRDYLGIVGVPIFDADVLGPEVTNYDMLVCGSDQIWNPSIQRGLDPVYFLDIPAAKRARKVAYAPSFGRNRIEPEYNSQLFSLVSGLHGISVREPSGHSILIAAGVPPEAVTVVPDPTILHGHFNEILSCDGEIHDELFCYALRTDDVIREVAGIAGTKLGLSLISSRTSRQRWRDIGTGVYLDPLNWLRMLARAKMVVSNSFHGVAISIVLNKPFIAVALPGRKVGLNARVDDLLAMTGLQDRMIQDHAAADAIEQLVCQSIDWEAVNTRLAKARLSAERYLESQIVACRG